MYVYFNGLHFNQVLKAMRESDSTKPAIFAMSNPTMNGFLQRALISLWKLKFILTTHYFLCIFYGSAECTAAEAFKHAGDNIVFASGSPFENVDLGNVSS